MRQFTQKAFSAVVALALASSLTACNKEDEATKSTATTSEAEATSKEASTEAASAETDKIVIKHAYGESEFQPAPDRPVAVRNAVDALLALGIKPVAFVGIESELKQPWRKELLKDVEFIPYDDAALEKVLAYKPNLVIGDQWVVGQEFYDMVSPYAPVVAPKNKARGEGNDWHYRNEVLGKIYGKEAEAKKIESDYKEMIEKAKADLPNLEGKTVLSADFTADGTVNVVVDPDDPSYYLFRDLGMTVPKAVQDDLLSRASSGRVQISYEEIKYLDADLLILGATGMTKEEAYAKVDEVPGLKELPCFQKDHVLFDEAGANNQAMSKPTALNREWLLNYVRPNLEKIGK